MKNRLLLNLVLLIFIGLAFAGITSAINMMANTQIDDDHEFSYIKRKADQHWYQSEFEDAARYYKQLADADQTNSNGRFLYAYSLTKVIDRELNKLSANSTEQDVESCRNKLASDIESSIEGFIQVTQFTQFRNLALVRLSLLYGFIGENEKSLEYAFAAYKGGHRMKDYMKLYRKYRCLDVFAELATKIRADQSTS